MAKAVRLKKQRHRSDSPRPLVVVFGTLLTLFAFAYLELFGWSLQRNTVAAKNFQGYSSHVESDHDRETTEKEDFDSGPIITDSDDGSKFDLHMRLHSIDEEDSHIAVETGQILGPDLLGWMFHAQSFLL